MRCLVMAVEGAPIATLLAVLTEQRLEPVSSADLGAGASLGVADLADVTSAVAVLPKTASVARPMAPGLAAILVEIGVAVGRGIPTLVIADPDSPPTPALVDLPQAAVRLDDDRNLRLRRGIALGKLSKVLHLKRPALFPILDSRLILAYRGPARAAADRYRSQRAGAPRSYWAAIRDGVANPANVAALDEVRRALRQHENALVRRVGDLGDVRLLDLFTWKPERQEQR